jgi:hypothetical protein
MDRRRLLTLFGMAGLSVLPRPRRLFAGSKSARARSFLIVAEDRSAADRLWRGASEAGQVDSALTVLDCHRDRDAVAALLRRFGPNTQRLPAPILVRVDDTHSGEAMVWTTEWLDAWQNNHIKDACYPISGNWWSVDGDWNPTREIVRDHLFTSMNHVDGHFEYEWLDLLTLEELQSIHSDHHREMAGDGTVYWDQVNAECPGE